MFVFLVEIVVSSVVKEEYWLGFYFWIDVIATLSMISDIGWIWDVIIGTDTGGNSGIAKSTQLTRAARASRAGTRAGRIIRMIRIIRLTRIVKLYKIAQEVLPDTEENHNHILLRSFVTYRGDPAQILLPQSLTTLEPLDDDEDGVSVSHSLELAPTSDCRLETERQSAGTIVVCNSRRTSTNYENTRSSAARTTIPPVFEVPMEREETSEMDHPQEMQESVVGQRLSDITTKRVILLVLAMILLMPMFSSLMYIDENNSYTFGLTLLDEVSETDDFDYVWDDILDLHKNLFVPVIYLEVVGRKSWQSMNPDDLRSSEKQITINDRSHGSRNYVSHTQCWIIADLRPFNRIQAELNIGRTVFVCVMLCGFSLLFSKDANELVIGPIERMTERIRRIAQNPLQASVDEEIKKLALEGSRKSDKGAQEMETEVLENIIVKIGALLALGFGEAGTEIITANIKRGSGDIDPMIPGKKTYCIFGFCDIRGFAEVTEVLQEGVMVFVNEIAQIVHNTVYKYSGATNKNIGDAFLIVWKIPKALDTYFKATVFEPVPYLLHQYADLSLIAFLKVLATINSDQSIMKYRLSSELCERMPNFSVKMGFGLHVGWAIEGAIGSEYKVDASYLSPNVNMASRLEAATRQFGVPILVSGQLHDLFSIQVQLLTRQIDCVMVKGSKVPIRLYTCDVSLANLPSLNAIETHSLISSKTAKAELRKQRDRILKAAITRQREVWRFFETDAHLIAMRERVSTHFLEMFREGFDHYIRGDWPTACRLLLAAIGINGGEDGPSKTLINYMDLCGGKAPADWLGHRELTEK